MIIPLRQHGLSAASALLLGTLVAVHYARLDLTLSHYDARAHLVVARRILDNLTPGWWLIGAIWLPLPHLLNALLTEPLLFGLMLLAIARLVDWCGTHLRHDADPSRRRADARTIGALFALACLTRYEAWPVSGAAIALTAFVLWRRHAPGGALQAVASMAAWPLGAMLGFMAFSRVVIGEWFVTSGFYVPDNPVRGRPLAVAGSILQGVVDLSGMGLLVLGLLGLTALLACGVAGRDRSRALVPLALVTTAVLPFSAFFAGHPHRVRYMVPLIAAQAIGAGALAGLWRRTSWATALLATAVVALELRPLDANAAMVLEAQWDRPSAMARRAVTECLRREWDGEAILASMGSLGHYMQELSHAGFDVRDFIHEGNEAIWDRAVIRARPFAGWVLLSEREDNRDALAGYVQKNPALLEGFARVCEGGLVALYRRVR